MQTVTHLCQGGHHKTHPSAASLHEHNANKATSVVVLQRLRILSGEAAHVLLIKISRFTLGLGWGDNVS